MDPKTVTTILIVLVCLLFLPAAAGLIGAVFGILGGILGGVFGLIGGLFGAVFGVIGGVFAAIFGFFGWLFGNQVDGHWPAVFFNGDLFTVILIIVVVVLLARSRTGR